MDPQMFYTARTVRKRIFQYEPKTFEIYQVFKSQRQAFDYCDTLINRKGIAIFSFEFDKSKTGVRKFLISTLNDFWARYKSTPEENRHFYEVIRANHPCHLYFDLEFEVDLNPDADGAEMLRIFKDLVIGRMKTHLHLNENHVKIIELQSSSPRKFSWHLIFKATNGYCFRNNQDVRIFVNDMIEEWRRSLTEKRIQSNSLFVFNKQGELEPFIDAAVYSRNRNFRILGSSKIGKGVVLEMKNGGNDFITFKDSLVCDYENLGSFFEISDSHVTLLKKSPKMHTSQVRLQGSSFPLIEDFVLRKIVQDDNSSIQSTLYYEQSNTILLTIRGSRFCNRIGRHHKSNQIYYVVKLSNGEILQKCFDPDCAHFAFPVQRLPECLYKWPVNDGDVFKGLEDSKVGNSYSEVHNEYSDRLFEEIDDASIVNLHYGNP